MLDILSLHAEHYGPGGWAVAKPKEFTSQGLKLLLLFFLQLSLLFGRKFRLLLLFPSAVSFSMIAHIYFSFVVIQSCVRYLILHANIINGPRRPVQDNISEDPHRALLPIHRVPRK